MDEPMRPLEQPPETPEPSPPSPPAPDGDQVKSGQSMLEEVKTWVMVALTAFFIVLYTLALLGYISPLKDDSLVEHLQPIIFAIIGYYFGRIPAQQNEKSLQRQVDGQQQENAQLQRRQGELQKDVAESHAQNAAAGERLRNARQVLETATGTSSRAAALTGRGTGESLGEQAPVVVAAALQILEDD